MSDYLVPARAMVSELEQAGDLEVRRAAVVGRALATYVEKLGRSPRGVELEEWFEAQPMVDELFATLERLEEAAYRHFSPLFVDANAPREARDAEIEAQLLSNLDDPDAYLVYADWLQERGDPLGELIALGTAATLGAEGDEQRFRRLLDQRKAHFLSAIARQPPERLTLRWRYGLVHRIEATHALEADVWRELLALPVCRFVQQIEFGSYHGGIFEIGIHDGSPLEAIGAEPRPSLRSLSLVKAGHVTLPAALCEDGLRELSVEAFRFNIPDRWPSTLETLMIDVDQLAASDQRPIDELAHPVALSVPGLRLRLRIKPTLASWLPALELSMLTSLTLDIRAVESPKQLARDLRRLLGRRPLPALTHLGLVDGKADAEVLRALLGLPCVEQLTSLSLTGLQLRDDALPALNAQRSRLSQLAELDLSDNELTAEGVKHAREIVPKVLSRRQERPGTAREAQLRRFSGSRYEVAREIANPDGKQWLEWGLSGEQLWARYQGTESYFLHVTGDLKHYGCSCPSSVQPCKHVVALLLIADERPPRALPAPFDEGG